MPLGVAAPSARWVAEGAGEEWPLAPTLAAMEPQEASSTDATGKQRGAAIRARQAERKHRSVERRDLLPPPTSRAMVISQV